MKDLFTLDQQSFLLQVNRIINRETKEVMLELRAQVVDNSNFPEEFSGFYLHNLNLDQILGLALWSWYSPEEIRYMLQMDLEEYSKKLSLEDQFIVKTIIENRVSALNWLLETHMFHSRDFYGNFLRQLTSTVKRLRFKRYSKKVKFPQRKRGYHDHGTLAPIHTWTPKYDFSLTEEQNVIEEKRKAFQDTQSFLKGWLE